MTRRLGCLLLVLATTVALHAQTRIIHVYVALADNEHQGIVPVSKVLGNGDDPARNLYWGSAYGVKAFFARSADWQLVAQGLTPKSEILERCIFKHRTLDVYLIADAYRGLNIQQAMWDFLDAAAGNRRDTVNFESGKQRVNFNASPALVAYIGHDGLMDADLPTWPRKKPGSTSPAAILLACASKQYFRAPLFATGAEPLLWTTGLMAPEAYTLKAALDGWLAGEGGEQVRERAAVAYDKYQKCGLKASRRLFTTGR